MNKDRTGGPWELRENIFPTDEELNEMWTLPEDFDDEEQREEPHE